MTSRLLIGSLTCGAVVAFGALGGSAQAPGTVQQGGVNITRQVQSQAIVPLPSLSPLVERVTPAVVNVSVVMGRQEVADEDQDEDGSANPQSPFDELLRRFYEQQGMPNNVPQRPHPRAGHATALGSGFLIDPEGDIVTNNHVVGNAEKVTVIFADNSKHPAHIVGRDEQTDIALLRINAPKPLPFVAWGDSDAAKVGDWVVAVGNPFGLGGTVTSGIISALGRNIQAGPYDDFLQIDASINRGNSGGPTFDLSGQVIGINTAIYSPSGGSVGIGFAVPSNLAKTVVAELKTQGHVTRGWLGVQVQSLTPDIAKGLDLDPDSAKGALVADVNPDSPAARAGIKQGDVITRFNGKEVKDVHDLPRLVAETPVGQKADITVLRNGREQPVQVTIGELKGQPRVGANDNNRGQSERPRPRRSSALGMQFAPKSDASGEAAGKPDADSRVVVVREVAPDSVAAGLIEPGDVIVAINQEPVTDPSDAAQRLRVAASNKQALLLVRRDGTMLYVGLPLEDARS